MDHPKIYVAMHCNGEEWDDSEDVIIGAFLNLDDAKRALDAAPSVPAWGTPVDKKPAHYIKVFNPTFVETIHWWE